MDPQIKYVYPSGGHAPSIPQLKAMEIRPTPEFFEMWKKTDANHYIDKHNLNPEMLDKFWHDVTTDPDYHLGIPEICIDIENGRPAIQFLNGRWRFVSLAEKGIQSIPVIVKNDNHQSLAAIPWLKPLSEANRRILDGDNDDPYRSLTGEHDSLKEIIRRWAKTHGPEIKEWFSKLLNSLLIGAGIDPSTLSQAQTNALLDNMTSFYQSRVYVPQPNDLQRMTREVQATVKTADPQEGRWSRHVGGPGGLGM